MKSVRSWAVTTVIFAAVALGLGISVIRSQLVREPGTELLEGVRDLTSASITLLKIPFGSAHLEFRQGHTQRLAWSCDTTAGGVAPKVVVNAGIATFDLASLESANCLISLPVRTGVYIRGESGHMHLEKPASDIDIAVKDGSVQIAPDPKRAYNFDVQVKNGLHDFFPRSGDPNAVHVKVHVMNGSVKHE